MGHLKKSDAIDHIEDAGTDSDSRRHLGPVNSGE